MDNDQFIAACREGASRLETALRVLDREVGPALHRDCAAAVKDPALARDIVQETLIKVWQRCATFRGEGALLHWIKGIARRTVIDFLRAMRPESALEDETGDMPVDVQRSIAQMSLDADLDPRRRLERQELQACYRRCFAAFQEASPLHATVMRWVIEDGLSIGEVAELLDRTPGATREFVSQARKKVRVHFAEWYAMVAADETASRSLTS